jgi:Predicted nucleic acid-binding protein, contains PIN domain
VVIVDSTVWVDYFNGLPNPETDWLDGQMDQQRLGLTTIIVCEVLQGLREERKAIAVATALRQFEVFEMPNLAVALQAARNYRTLRSRGRTVRKTVDVLIATFCIEEQHSLLHRDRDFDPFEELLGLSVVHP